MYSVTITVLDGHNGLGTPDTELVKTRVHVVKFAEAWAENTSFDDDEEKAYVLDRIWTWDGKDQLSFTDGDGQSIVIQHHEV